MRVRWRSRLRTTTWCYPFYPSPLAFRGLGVLFAYTMICPNIFAASLGLLQTEHQCRALAAEHLPCAGLRALPGGRDALQELAPFRRDLELRAALVCFVRLLFDPALSEDDLQIACQRRGIEVKALAEIDPSHRAGLGDGDQQVELACLEAPIAHLGFIDAGQHAVQLAPVSKQTLARNLVDDARMGRGASHETPPRRYLYIQVSLSMALPAPPECPCANCRADIGQCMPGNSLACARVLILPIA